MLMWGLNADSQCAYTSIIQSVFPCIVSNIPNNTLLRTAIYGDQSYQTNIIKYYDYILTLQQSSIYCNHPPPPTPHPHNAHIPNRCNFLKTSWLFFCCWPLVVSRCYTKFTWTSSAVTTCCLRDNFPLGSRQKQCLLKYMYAIYASE